jgi:pimeloyl-ACP methyl ester carboxylesterase
MAPSSRRSFEESPAVIEYTIVYMLVFDREGSGAPLVPLHGTNSSRSIWKPLLPELIRQREVFSVDLPAHGQSPPS